MFEAGVDDGSTRHGRRKETGSSTAPTTSTSPAEAAGTAGSAAPPEAAPRRVIPLWWTRFLGRLEAEEDALRRDAIVVKRDEDAFRRGVLRLQLTLPQGMWLTRRLDAVFPDMFPYLRPEVYAPELRLRRHQNPFKGNLCLLGRRTEYWNPSTTLASLLATQLPRLTEVLKLENPGETIGLEDEQGEPLTAFLDYEEDGIVLIDSAWKIDPDIRGGSFSARLLVNESFPLRAVILRVNDEAGNVIATAPFGREDRADVRGRWIKLESAVIENRPEAFVRATNLTRELDRTPWQSDLQLLGITFPEELTHRREGMGWTFLARRRENAKGFRAGHAIKTAFIRTGRLGVSDLSSRLPVFEALQGATVAIFGTGCLGAPSLLELAKAGVGELRFLDGDVVEAGTIVRWPFGIPAVGRDKAKTLAEH